MFAHRYFAARFFAPRYFPPVPITAPPDPIVDTSEIDFEETERFPEWISFGSKGGPSFKTSVQVMDASHETRNQLWSQPRCKYEVQWGIRGPEDYTQIMGYFRAMRGRKRGFRYKDWSDFSSVTNQISDPAVTALDQPLGTGDGTTTTFQLVKVYNVASGFTRTIVKPVPGTVRVAVDGVEDFSSWLVTNTGKVVFGVAPALGAVLTAGFEFDVPCRFDTDDLNLTIDNWGQVTGDVPLMEVRFKLASVGTTIQSGGEEPAYSGPLDIVTGAVAAYSQRALSTANLGSPLYTIRRDSDDTTQSFSSDGTTGDAPVADITTFLGGANGFIETWNDQSASAADASQATLSIQPSWVASANNSLPGIYFPNTGGTTPGPVFYLLSSNDLSFTSGGATVFAVVEVSSANPYSNFIFATTNAVTNAGVDLVVPFGLPEAAGGFYCDIELNDGTEAAGGDSAGPVASIPDQYALIEGAIAFGTWSIKVNGVALSQFDSSDTGALGAFNAGPITIGADGPAETLGADALLGTLQELIIYSGVVSDANRTLIRQNIATYYGITI